MSIVLGTLGFIFLSLPAIGAVVGIVISRRRRHDVSPVRWAATIISLAAVIAENAYFIVVFVFLPSGTYPVYNDAAYQHHERLEVLGIRSLLAVLLAAVMGIGVGRMVAIAGTVMLFLVWLGTGIKPW